MQDGPGRGSIAARVRLLATFGGVGLLLLALPAGAAVGVGLSVAPDCGYDADTNTFRPVATVDRFFADDATDTRASVLLQLFDSDTPTTLHAQLSTGVTADAVQQNGAFNVPVGSSRSFTPEAGAVFGDGNVGGAALSVGHDYLLRVRLTDFSSVESQFFGPYTCRTSDDTDGDGLTDDDETDVWLTDPFDPDTDGDALSDGAEALGYDANDDDVIDLALPSFGVSPRHADILVQVDYMVDGGHSHAPSPSAIATVVSAFAAAPVSNPDGTQGIRLHVDYGPAAPSFGGGTWGASSGATAIAHQTNLGSGHPTYNWSTFNSLESANLDVVRRPFFHYAVFAHDLATGFDGTSGISREIVGSGFVVSLGSWTNGVGSEREQAGTFMHELGHNLGLRHGGAIDEQFKPNYPSVMNYLFQTLGVIKNGTSGTFDYSRGTLPLLNEASLDESAGIGTTIFGTKWFCAADQPRAEVNATQVDWDCDGTIESGVQANLNVGYADALDSNLDVHTDHDDWSALVFGGGAVGDLGAAYLPPTETTPEPELTDEVAALIPDTTSPKSTSTTYTGDPSVQYSDQVTLSGTLSDTSVSPSVGVAGKQLAFTLGTQSANASPTSAAGSATTGLLVTQAPGSVSTVGTAFAGDTAHASSSDSDSFSILREDCTLAYSGDTLVTAATATQLVADFGEPDASLGARGGKSVTFTVVGSSPSSQTFTALTNSSGRASVSANLGPDVYGVSVSFPGDGFYEPCATTSDTLVTVQAALAKVTGGGWIAIGTGRASFGLNAVPVAGGWTGQIQTRSSNGKNKFHGTAVTTLTSSGNSATWSGPGRWNGVPGHTYTITVVDNGSSGSKRGDTITIVIRSASNTVVFTTGGAGALKGGNISVRR